MGKRVKDIQPGETYWYTYIECSKTGRCKSNKVPFQCVVKDNGRNFYTIGPICWIRKDSDNEIEDYGIYETYEEAVDAYNGMIYNLIDRFTSMFESIKKRLLKKVIKK